VMKRKKGGRFAIRAELISNSDENSINLGDSKCEQNDSGINHRNKEGKPSRRTRKKNEEFVSAGRNYALTYIQDQPKNRRTGQ